MKIGAYMAAVHTVTAAKSSGNVKRRLAGANYAGTKRQDNSIWAEVGSRIWPVDGAAQEGGKDAVFGVRTSKDRAEGASKDGTGEADRAEESSKDRSEAEKIYQAAVSGKPNPLEELCTSPKVPYGHLAKDGVIIYNGVVFTCDEKTNSICLGDMTDKKKVLNIPLSGGGHLKVNRDSLGLLSKAVGMFSPEDLNLIMRAIAQDTKIQSMEKEIEDTEASVGNQLKSDGESSSGQEEGDE